MWAVPRPHRVDPAGQPLRLLCAHAHPDDESSKGAATMARYVSEGVEVLVVTCTGGERGDVLNPRLDRPEVWANLAEIRRAEMVRAREILGVQQAWLGFVDSGMPSEGPLPDGCFAAQPLDVPTGAMVQIIRRFRPHVVVTYDELGGYPHPDHIMCHRVSMAGIEQAADPDLWPEHGPAWTTMKVYYQMGFHRARFARLDAMMHENGLESPYAERLKDWDHDENADRLTTFVPCADWFETRNRALLAHATQIDPDGSWFAVPLAIQQAGWPTEDYQLVRSTVDTTIPEDDLFAGIAVPAPASDDDWTL